MDNRLEPSNLVRLRLLELAALTGATFDTFADPHLLLDRERRHACRKLAQNVASSILGTLRFLEELALVGALTPDQVAALQTPSDSAKKALTLPSAANRAKVAASVTQMIPKAGTTTSLMPYLMLAGARAREPVQLANAPGHSLSLELDPVENEFPSDAELSFLEFRPLSQASGGFFSCQGRLVIHAGTQTACIRIKPVDGYWKSRWPLVLSGAASEPTGAGEHELAISIKMLWPAVSVDDLESIRQMATMVASGDEHVDIIDDATGRSSCRSPLH
jgi:hypothetical protein